jgi:formylglycine-generating enzyme required for sulfatase activity
MGSNEDASEKPVRQVTVQPFAMGKFPVSVQEWNACAAAKACGFTATGKDDAPVANVSWNDAKQYVAWLAETTRKPYRLPSEAEWEYAARGGLSQKRFVWGDEDPGDDKAFCNIWQGEFPWKNTLKDGYLRTSPIKTFKPNGYGLYDMAGNVWEWCNDFYATKYYRESPAENPRGPTQGEKRVLRGGAWSSSAGNCTSWVRNCDEAGLTDVCLTMDSNGFRCVRRER